MTLLRIVHACVPLRIRRSVIGTLLIGVVSSPLYAEVPAVTAIFPAGVQAGQTVTAKLQGGTGTAPVEVWTDRTDLSVKMGEKPDEMIVSTTPETRPGMAWFRWHNAEGASDLRPFAVGTVPEIQEAEPNNSPKEPQAITALPATINGVLEKHGDLDTYAVNLKAGETLVASLEGSRLLPSPMDAVLQLVDTSGFVIAQNEDTNFMDPQLVWTAPTDGCWLVRAFAFPMAPDSTIQFYGSPNSIYRLHLTTGPVISHLAPLVRQAGDYAATGWNLSGERVSVTGDAGSLRLSPFSSGAIPYTPFDLEQLPTLVGTAVVEDPAAMVQPVSLFPTITGVIEGPGDADTYRFQGTKGQAIRIQTHTRSAGSLLDPLIRFRNSAGQLVTEQDDSGELPDPNFDIIIPADEEYSVEITDRYGAGSPQHFYSLVIGPETPNFELTLAANRYTLDRTKPLEIPLTVNRMYGHKTSIQVSVEGLPAGVTLEPIESLPEGDTSKAVTLKLSVAADAAAAKGPIRVVGRSTAPDLQLPAKGPIEGMKLTTDQLWLTLPAKAP